jgi:hypothetical protein
MPDAATSVYGLTDDLQCVSLRPPGKKRKQPNSCWRIPYSHRRLWANSDLSNCCPDNPVVTCSNWVRRPSATGLPSGLCLLETRPTGNHYGGYRNAARLDRDWLSRGMSSLGSIRAHARRYKELQGTYITRPLPADADDHFRCVPCTAQDRSTANVLPLFRTIIAGRPLIAIVELARTSPGDHRR